LPTPTGPAEFTGGVDKVAVGGLSIMVAMLFGLIAM
jgi:hypothetical protein